MVILNENQVVTVLRTAAVRGAHQVKPEFLTAALFGALELAKKLCIENDPYMDNRAYMEKEEK